MKVTAQQKEMLKAIVQRLINLEYQLKNTDHMTKIEVSAAPYSKGESEGKKATP